MSQDPLIGQQLDEYELESLLGQGGMARVYRAVDVRLRRYAAVKVIDTPFQSNTDYTRRFEREAQAIAQLEHPHIVRLYRYGDVDNLLYMAMQFVEGVDLHAMLLSYEEQGELMAPDDLRRIIRQICVALDYAHSKGVIHRDIKPANVLIDPAGEAILSDFGLSLMTEMGTQGEILGTPQYIAPEQAISSAGAMPQSDLYAVGVMLYRMATGTLPFDDSDSMAVVMQHITDPPPPPSEKRPSINPQLEAVILKSLAKEPSNRYPTGAALADAVDAALQQAPSPLVTAPALSIMERVNLNLGERPSLPAAVSPPPPEPIPTPPPAEPEPATRQLPLNVGTIAFGVIVLLIIGFFWLRGSNDETELEPAAEVPATEMIVTETSTAVDTSDDTPTVVPATSTTPPQEAATATAVPAQTTTAVTNNNQPTTHIAILPLISSALEATPTTAATATTVQPTITPEPVTNYNLLLTKSSKTLFLINQSDQDFPLNAFSLVTDERNPEILSEWQRTSLPAGECLLINKDDKAKEQDLPESCTRANGDPLIFSWKDDFTLHYQGNAIQTCDVKNNTCQLTIPSN